MKNIIYSAIVTLSLLPLAGFAQPTATPWPELKSFHAMISATFHPSEEGNFKPLRQKADSLLIVAKLWQASPIPEGYKIALTKSTLIKLVKQCGLIKTSVKSKTSDAKLKMMISEAHDIFHTIVEKCREAEM